MSARLDTPARRILREYLLTSDPLGYSLDNRLAFLRAYHADPVDIAYNQMDGALSMDIAPLDNPAITGALQRAWLSWRNDLARSFVDRLIQASQLHGPKPVLINKPYLLSDVGWYLTAHDPTAALDSEGLDRAALRSAWTIIRDGSDPSRIEQAPTPARFAASRGAVALFAMTGWPSMRPEQIGYRGQLPDTMASQFGYVLDLAPTNIAFQLDDTSDHALKHLDPSPPSAAAPAKLATADAAGQPKPASH